MLKKAKRKCNNLCLKLFKFFSRLIVISAFVIVVFVLFFSFNGLPDFLIRQGFKIPNRGSFHFDVERVQLNFFSGVILKNIYIYRKEKPGEAGVHIKSMEVDINWFDLFQKHRRIRKVKFLNTTVNSRQLIVPSGDGEGVLPPPFDLYIESELYFKDLYLDGVWFQEVKFDAKCRGDRMFAEHIDGSLGNLVNPGSFSNSKLTYDSSKALIDIDLDAKLNPYYLIPLLTRWGATTLVSFIQRFDKETMNDTVFEGIIKRDFTREDSMLIKGDFKVGGSSYNAVDFLMAASRLTIYTSRTKSSIAGKECRVFREKGSVFGNFVTEDDYSDIRFQGTSTIEPVELLKLMNIKNRFVESVDFITQPTVTATGSVCPDNYTNNAFFGKIESGNFIYSNFYFSGFSSGVIVNGTTNQFQKFDSDFYDGKLTGDLTFNILDNTYTNVKYYGNFSLDSVNYGLFAAALDIQNSEDVSGRLHGKIKLDGSVDENLWSRMDASGYISIKNGWLFRMRIFGGLTKLLAKIIPGLDFVMSQSDATVDFEMKNGVAEVSRFVLNGDVLSISGNGSVNMVEQTYNMKFQMKFMKQHTFVARFINTVVWPISKLFEMRLTGTFEEPVWKAVNF
jgi:hypothetical protein